MEHNSTLIKKMKDKKIAYLSIGLGLTIMALSPKEKLSTEEKNAGVITYGNYGGWMVVFGGFLLAYQYLNKK